MENKELNTQDVGREYILNHVVSNAPVQKEFTFGDLFKLIKKSWYRIVIFCLIAAFTMGVVCVATYYIRKPASESISTMIAYNYSGIEDGNDPLGGKLNVNLIKSPSVVNDAINSLGENGMKITVNQTNLINSITIEGRTPEDILQKIQIIKEIATKDPSALSELNDISYFPSEYLISLKNFKSLGLDRSTAKALLDEIISQYAVYFRETFMSQSLLVTQVIYPDRDPEVGIPYDFLDLYDNYYTQLQNSISLLNTKAVEAPTFRGSKAPSLTFAELVNNLTDIRSRQLARYESIVLQNALTYDLSTINFYFDRRLTSLQSSLKQAEDSAAAVKTTIDEYRFHDYVIAVDKDGNYITIGGPNTEEYDRKMKQWENYLLQAESLKATITRHEERMDLYAVANPNSENEDLWDQAEKYAASVADAIKAALIDANTVLEEYLDTQYFNDAVDVKIKSVYSANMGNTAMILIAITAVVVILTAVVAILVTNSALKKKGIPLDEDKKKKGESDSPSAPPAPESN